MSGGAHIVFRKSPNSYSFNAVSSSLTVPTDALASYPVPGNANYNSVPEFFHVFFSGVYTIDVGVAYANNGYYDLFANVDGVWHSGPRAKATGTKTLKSWLSAEGNKRYIITQFGSMVHKVPLEPQVYNALNKGCKIFREMVIASNKYATLPADAYYKNAEFSNTTLTRTNGTYVSLNSNCDVVHNKLDDNISISQFKKYCDSDYSESGSSFVTDISSATFNKNDYPIDAIYA